MPTGQIDDIASLIQYLESINMLKAAAAVRLQAAAGHNSTAGRHVSARTASVPAVKIERRRWVKNLTKDIRENPKEFNG